jgi:dTDP-4-dehydrorhamnose reductase
MKILVTGAYGQLGAELCRLLGADAIPVDVDTVDLANGPAVRKTVLNMAPAAVIHCGAYTQVDQAEIEPERCRTVNARAVEYLAEACVRLDCPLVQISTDYVFCGEPERRQPRREEDPVAPCGVYALTKFEGEKAAARNKKHLIVRTCGLYARPSHEQARNFVKTILRVARAHKKLRVVADQYCTPTYVPHLARAILFLAGTNGRPPAPWGLYHVTNRGETTWFDFAREIVRLAGVEVSVEAITTAEYGAAAPRPAYSVLDTSAYHRLGGPAMPDWREALAEYFAELNTPPKAPS